MEQLKRNDTKEFLASFRNSFDHEMTRALMIDTFVQILEEIRMEGMEKYLYQDMVSELLVTKRIREIMEEAANV